MVVVVATVVAATERKARPPAEDATGENALKYAFHPE